ncbi:Phosphoglycerol transferase MdoB [Oscillibacter sp. PC13]|uniref:LTA synthase family protein n=1 Tax=Oscillibacter sp. PC13 TaxID=1855299 RepID=UPI0008EB904F|nr:LTA synthase family protein [Oscillibacter sp. PC13]SFP50720.1 Phosphoglycerol transferase MdoB [Oscillibacter sp. PC13]
MKRKRKTSAAPDAKHPQERRAFLYMVLLALLDTLVIELFNHKTFTEGLGTFLKFVTEAPLALLVNVMLVLATLVPAMFLRRQVFWCVLASAVWLAAGAANGFILLNRMTPFTIADLTVLNSGLDTLPNYLSKGYIALLATGLIGLLVGLILLFWRGPKSPAGGRRRILSGLLALIISGGALAASWSAAFQTRQLSTVFSNLAFAYEDYGFSYCFLETWLNKGIPRPIGYQASSVRAVEARVEENMLAEAAPAQTDVNIIYVQLESFVDPNEIKGLELSENAVPNWTALTEQYASGYLTVPVVGAGTANTEFEMLTGMSTRFFGPGEYPYETRMLDRTAESVAYDLKENGYATHAIHNHRATFYSRNQVYANLGFDDFTSLEYMPKAEMTPKNWAKDRILTGEIVKALDATPNQPDLVFTVSVQGHGKYPKTQVLVDPAITVEACPDQEYQYAFEYYVNQIREMDTFVGELTSALEERSEKTVLVLYGDHLPALNLETHDMKSGSLYRTRYVVWNNFGLEKQDEDLASYQLSASVLGELGITTGFLNRFHQVCREEPTYRLDLKLLQYDVLYGRRYLYGDTSPYEPTDMQMGMVPITVRGLYPWGKNWMVTGENFSPYCEVTVDGKQLDTEYRSSRILCLTEDPGTESYRDLDIRVVDKHNEVLSDTE